MPPENSAERAVGAHPARGLRNARKLARELRAHVQGEVRFDAGSRALYSTAASNYRHVPIGVVVPRDADDVVAAVAICRKFGVPVLSRGGGTSLAGQSSNVAVVIDFSKYLNRIVEIDAVRRTAVVEPGLILDTLRGRSERHHLTFGPDPATHNRCTLGGMIGNNSCGVHSVMAGCTADNVEELDVLTYDGVRFSVGATSAAKLMRHVARGGREADILGRLRKLRDRHATAIRRGFPTIPRRVSGYNLPALLPENGFHLARALVGSEGTLVTVLRATVKLVPSPPSRVLVVLGYPSVYEAADHIPEILESPLLGLEGIDDVLVEAIRKKGLDGAAIERFPEGSGWLLAEVGGDTPEEALHEARALQARLATAEAAPHTKVFSEPTDAERIWRVRESGLGATARVPGEGDTWEGWEDASVPPERLGAYLRDFRGLLGDYGFHAALYGHFGQGCVHTRIPFDLRSAGGVAQYRAFVQEAADLVVRYGGSLSGEHGDGQSRAELLPRMFGGELMHAFGELKLIWDPDNGMNPGKIVEPRRLDQDLRLRAEHVGPQPKTHFRFPDDRRSFLYATERCVGVGECRRLDGGTMCPSFMVTREEAHSTRGRAHLLFELLRGGTRGRSQTKAVREALDLCLSCKGCKSDCPVGVDVATYKAEFLAQFYRWRLRPRSAYLFGLIHWWARLGSMLPSMTNYIAHAPGLSRALKLAAGVAQQRDFPPLAPVTFRAWWRSRPACESGGPRVLLWVDTFNDHWQPSVLIAATEVLEGMGFQVLVTDEPLCCGRPLYEHGMLPLAKRLLRKTLTDLAPLVRAGVPVVGLEPSCMAVFREELGNLYPDDPLAQALRAQACMLDELICKNRSRWRPPHLARAAIVHAHCHQKAIMRLDHHAAILHALGVDATVLDSGCCGMAGGFGYERAHYALSIACGERRLLPAVRGAPQDGLLIADGFSCRDQIRQQTGRRALHLAEVIQLAMRNGSTSANDADAKRACSPSHAHRGSGST